MTDAEIIKVLTMLRDQFRQMEEICYLTKLAVRDLIDVLEEREEPIHD